MPNPTIADARTLATKLRHRGVVILAFGTTHYGGASYGMTRRDCTAMGSILEQCFDRIETGSITLPANWQDCQRGPHESTTNAILQLEAELIDLRKRYALLAERVHAQAELLSKRAERPTT